MAKENELFAVRSTWVSLFSLSLFPFTLRPHFSRHNNSLSISECTNCISDIFQQETEDEKVKLHIKLS